MRTGLCLVLLVMGAAAPCHARPWYVLEFVDAYPGLKEQVKAFKCAVCHPAKKKSVRNDYGAALARELGEELRKRTPANRAKFRKGMTDVEGQENAAGVTFGELIENGKLPGNDEPAK